MPTLTIKPAEVAEPTREQFAAVQQAYFKLFALIASGVAIPLNIKVLGMDKLIEAGVFTQEVAESDNIEDEDDDIEDEEEGE